MSRALSLVRRWAIDWLCSHDPSVLPSVVSDDYILQIGATTIRGRGAYERAVMGQLEQFPGLMLTVHEVMGNDERAAIRFTEHGASVVHEGRVAAWAGIALFRTEGEHLSVTFAEEDYAARRRQLRSGEPDPVEAPHPAPWDVTSAAPDLEAVEAVKKWLASGVDEMPEGVLVDDQASGHAPAPLAISAAPHFDDIFSAGNQVAFHITQPEVRCEDSVTTLRIAGLVTVQNGTVVSGRLVRDRLGAVRRNAAN